MSKSIKLKEYCKANSIAYATGLRWFKNGNLPAKAYQTATGTILVEIEDRETSMTSNLSDLGVNTLTSFLQDLVGFSGKSVAEFGAHVLGKYQLSLLPEKKVEKEPIKSDKAQKDILSLLTPFVNRQEELKRLKESAKEQIKNNKACFVESEDSDSKDLNEKEGLLNEFFDVLTSNPKDLKEIDLGKQDLQTTDPLQNIIEKNYKIAVPPDSLWLQEMGKASDKDKEQFIKDMTEEPKIGYVQSLINKAIDDLGNSKTNSKKNIKKNPKTKETK